MDPYKWYENVRNIMELISWFICWNHATQHVLRFVQKAAEFRVKLEGLFSCFHLVPFRIHWMMIVRLILLTHSTWELRFRKHTDRFCACIMIQNICGIHPGACLRFWFGEIREVLQGQLEAQTMGFLVATESLRPNRKRKTMENIGKSKLE